MMSVKPIVTSNANEAKHNYGFGTKATCNTHSSFKKSTEMVGTTDLPLCATCGTQFDILYSLSKPPPNCPICDDPRQFVPPTGQAWTTLADLQKHHRNSFVADPEDPRITHIVTEPKVGIGQRCFLLETQVGNVLWDCIALIDEETVKFICSKGGLKAIVISHPHYYTTHLDWADAFDCPVWLAKEDIDWCFRKDEQERRKMLEHAFEDVLEGVTVAKTGGHFPGSLVLLWEGMLFIADTFVTVPSALYHVDRPPGTLSFAFHWSIPNMIPLPPNEMFKMWQILRNLDFHTTHGAFVGLIVRDKNVKARVLESMKIQTRSEGWEAHEILNETL